MNDINIPIPEWEENVILVDADWLDRLVFDVTVNFERMLERAIPKADLARWVDYLSLDGGLRPGDNKTQVLLIHSSSKKNLSNCLPSSFSDELNGKAFNDNLGEFLFSSFPVEEQMVSKGDLFIQSMEALLGAEQIKRLLIVPDMDAYGLDLRDSLRKIEAHGKEVTLFSLEPVAGFRCQQEMLTYSVLATLGISSDELHF